MSELFHHIGKDVDVPAGDIGVGAREIGYLFGQYKRLTNEFTGAITGKGLVYGGSLVRTEATGYGVVYLTREMLARIGQDVEGKVCVVSGSGNVAQYTVEKLIDLGARVVTVSDRSGFVYDGEGFNREKLDYLIDLKANRRGQLTEFAEKFGLEHHERERPWKVSCDLAFLSATQNEIGERSARALLENGCKLVCEGANMPTTPNGAKLFEDARILYAPSKAANAPGG